MVNKDAVVEALNKVVDPELGVDIWSLGLVYEVKVKGVGVDIKMTFTSPMCPVGPMIVEDVKTKVGAVKGVKDVKVEITFEPLWSPDRISEEVRATLGV